MPDQQPAEARTLDSPQGKHDAPTLSPTEPAPPETVPATVPGYDILAEVGRGGWAGFSRPSTTASTATWR